MKIDVIPKKMNAPAVPDTIFIGTKYVLAYSDGQTNYFGNPHGDIHYDLENNAISVLFSPDELEAFRPNDTVHGIIQSLLEGKDFEVRRLKELKKRQSTEWVDKITKEVINLKEITQEKIDFLESHTIVLVEVTFK